MGLYTSDSSSTLRLKPLVEDRHAPLVMLRPKTGNSVKILPKGEECQRGESWTLFPHVDENSLALPQPNRSAILGSPKPPNNLSDTSALRNFPECLCTHPPTQPSSVTRCCIAGRGRLSKITPPCLSPTMEGPARASSECSFLLMGSTT